MFFDAPETLDVPKFNLERLDDAHKIFPYFMPCMYTTKNVWTQWEFIYGQKNTSSCDKNIYATIYSTICIYSCSTCATYILVSYKYY